MFALIDLGERAGSGIPTIYDGWQQAYNELPSFTVGYNPDRTTLRLHCENIYHVLFKTEGDDISGDKVAIKSKSGDKVAIKPKSGDKKTAIVSYLTVHGICTSAEISAFLSLKASMTKRYLKQLTDEGTVEAIGANRNRQYRLKHN